LTGQEDFKYDLYGNRIEKSYDADGTGAGNATVTRFAYDAWKNTNQHLVGNENWDVWADLNGSSSLTTRYLRGDIIDQVFSRTDSGTAYWYLNDRLGSVRDIVNSGGTVKDSIAYNGFGGISSETDSSFRGRYAWTGRELDVESDLQYNRARYYDAVTGRWISQDPLGFDAGDSNLYRYVNNRTVNSLDPSGLYNRDMHFYLTFYVAASLCLHTVRPPNPNVAYLIAWGDERTDYDKDTAPIQGLSSYTEKAIKIRQKYHFRAPAHKQGKQWVYDFVEPGSKYARQPVQNAAFIQNGVALTDMFYMGIGLHAFQDSYSHRTWEAKYGHVKFNNPYWAKRDADAKHADDQFFSGTSQGRALAMARNTYDYLKSWRDSRYPNLGTKFTWDQIAAKMLERIATPGDLDERM